MAKRYTEQEVIAVIKDEISKASLRQVAARIGVSAPFLSDVVRGRRNVSDNLAGLFGFDREIVTTVTFRKRAA